MNDTWLGVITTACGVATAAAWAFTPGLWLEASLDRPQSALLPLLVTSAGILAIVLPTSLQRHKQWVTNQISEKRTEDRTELVGFIRGYLNPCLETLPSAAKPGRDGDEALATIKQAILGTVQQICGPSDVAVRAVWFEAQNQTLAPRSWKGGACNSTRKFVKRSTDPAGMTAWETAATGLPVLWANVNEQAPPGFVPSPHNKYETFITCGVLGASDEVKGMLNVDAPQANDLTDVDQIIVGVCATILSAAYILSELRASVSEKPKEVRPNVEENTV